MILHPTPHITHYKPDLHAKVTVERVAQIFAAAHRLSSGTVYALYHDMSAHDT